MTYSEGEAVTAVRVSAWATPAEGVTLDQLVTELGASVLEVDVAGNRLKVIDVIEEF